MRCVIVGGRPWVRDAARDLVLPIANTSWAYREDLPRDEHGFDCAFDPGVDYAFFIHWSEKVSPITLQSTRCVGFHMTDLPLGRGGSPLQHLILAGAHETVLTAFQMTEEMDAGPSYLKRPLSLAGCAEEIYMRAARLAVEMAVEIARDAIEPIPQVGPAGPPLKRRTPAESRLPAGQNLDTLHDFIRMLDCEGYPPAFLEWQGFWFEFHQSARYRDRIEATVTIRAL